MKLVPIDINAIPGPRKCSYRSLRNIFEEFQKMDCDAVYIDWRSDGYKDEDALYSSLRAGVKRYGYPFRVMMRKGEVYLVKEIG